MLSLFLTHYFYILLCYFSYDRGWFFKPNLHKRRHWLVFMSWFRFRICFIIIFLLTFFFFLVYLYAPVFFVQLVSILISIQTKSTLMLCLFFRTPISNARYKLFVAFDFWKACFWRDEFYYNLVVLNDSGEATDWLKTDSQYLSVFRIVSTTLSARKTYLNASSQRVTSTEIWFLLLKS